MQKARSYLPNLLNFLQADRWPQLNLFFFCLLAAVLSHAFFISEWFEGRYMTGMNDGLSQMQPFKQLLYELYTSGEFFYSPDFGFGGGTYTQLGYYFATSIVFLITAAVTFILESLGLIGTPDIFYWADIILIVSIIRLTGILLLASYYFRMLGMKALPAFTGSVIYGTSIIYFRHVTYWEFFADSMLWLLLLLIGIERIMRGKGPGLFIIAVSISLFDNFYFAYVNFLLSGVYVLFRWIFPFDGNERSKAIQLKQYIIGLAAGFSISGFSFFPAVYGYLNNYRPAYEDHIPAFEFIDNLLLNGRIVYLPAFVLICLLAKPLYRNTHFRFFAVMTIVLSILHFSPFIGSLFNGFSAPQYRWEYMLSLAAGGAAGAALPLAGRIRVSVRAAAAAGTALFYIMFYHFDPKLEFERWQDTYMLAAAFISAAVFLLGAAFFRKKAAVLLSAAVILTSVLIPNFYQEERLTVTGTEYRVSKDFMNSREYNGADQQELIRLVQEGNDDPLARIDWMIPLRNNTPIVQNFRGMSVYSSILNKELLWFYLRDLEIDMGRESVSRYASLGDRANLYSILMGKYYIAEKGDASIPYGFKRIASAGGYAAYENEYLLPFVRTADSVYLEKDLKGSSPAAKEQAMLKGIVLEEGEANAPTPDSRNLISQAEIKPVNAEYSRGKLKVSGEEGGIDLLISERNPSAKDYLVGFNIDGINNKEEFILEVNEFQTIRKEEGSIYRTGVDDLIIRVKAADRISFRMPKGEYHLKDFKLYEETFEVLENAKEEESRHLTPEVEWSGNRLSFELQKQGDGEYAVIPLPYEKGWGLKINGKEEELLKANYAFTGFRLQEGQNMIELVYYPPYFFQLLALSFAAISICFAAFIKNLRRVSARQPDTIEKGDPR
ncbi:YfhO family protein [Bacillus infantis]|uniref:YfhO family protein n=1 Tax=Bacillus infantis TaxID=324767 RepID=UPI003CEBC78F